MDHASLRWIPAFALAMLTANARGAVPAAWNGHYPGEPSSALDTAPGPMCADNKDSWLVSPVWNRIVRWRCAEMFGGRPYLVDYRVAAKGGILESIEVRCFSEPECWALRRTVVELWGQPYIGSPASPPAYIYASWQSSPIAMVWWSDESHLGGLSFFRDPELQRR